MGAIIHAHAHKLPSFVQPSFFAKKQRMHQNDENARTSNNVRAAIGGGLGVDNGGDDEASRDTFEVKAVMVPDDGSNGSSITKEGGREEVTWFVDRHGAPYDSPYEKEYSAETIEELFHEVSEFFGSLKVLDPTQDTDHLRFAKSRLRDFKSYSNTVENSFITAVCCARDEVHSSTVLWNDEWSEKRFGNYEGHLSIKHSVPDELLLMFVKPTFFAKAKRNDLLHFYTNRKLSPNFKEAIAKMDPGKQFPGLHRSPDRALRQAVHYKMLIFIVRAHLCMKLRGCISFSEVEESFGGGVRLKEKCQECFRKLEESIFNSLKRDDANEHMVDDDAGHYSLLTTPITPATLATPVPPVTKARLKFSKLSDQREAIFFIRGAERAESHSKSHQDDDDDDDDDDAPSDSNKKRPRDDADESNDAELDSMISKCDMLHKNWSRWLDELNDIREYLVKQKKEDLPRTKKKAKLDLLKKIQDLVEDWDGSE